jgi:signal transduction histidine kinase
VTTQAPSTRLTPWGIRVGRVAGIVGYAATVIASAPAHLRPVIVVLTLASGAGAAYGWRWGVEHWRRRLAGLAVLAAGGIAVVLVDRGSPGWFAVYFAISGGLARLPWRIGAMFAAGLAVAVTAVALRAGTGTALGVAIGAAGFAILGMTLGGARERAEAAERLLASERAAREAAAQAHVYAERQRLAREIHDILAHTLSAQIVHLEGVRMLLAHGAPPDAVRVQVERVQRLARDGLEETRRAVSSLRGRARPLPEALAALAQAQGARLAVTGEPRPVEPEIGLALERTVQEALTNARKHAPGAAVTVTLIYGPDGCEVEVRDTGAARAAGSGGALAGTGGGYGLAGMRERAELLGGELTAGPYPVGADGRGYRVWLKIPN